MSKNLNQLPIQKLPMSKKTLAWKEACVDYTIGLSEFNQSGGIGNGRTKVEEMQTYYDLYNSIYNEKDLLYVTNPFKLLDGFPATALDFNIIKPKIDLLLGEETKRPFNFKVVRTSDGASSEILDKAKQMLLDYIMASIMSKLSPEDQLRYQEAIQSGEVLPPELIHKYLTKDYKDIAEITAYHTLNYLKNKLNLSHEFYKGWKDGLIGGEEIYYVGILNGDSFLERVNPLYFSFDMSSDVEFIHDATWCCRKMIMSATDIYDRFYDKMSEKDLNQLLEMIEDTGKGGINPELRKNSLDYVSIKTHTLSNNDNPFKSSENINVWHSCWKSFKKIGFVTYIDPETGEKEEAQVDETYNIIGTEVNIEWTWVIEVWEGYRIGEDLYVGIQPLEYQHLSADNLNSQKLPYTGAIYNCTNSKPKSLVSMMKPLQYMYIVLWYRLELAIAKDNGKVALMDITLIPKSMGIDVNKWMHYLKALGVMFVNPYEEGFDIPGREGGKASAFNTFQSVDLTMSNTINLYIELMSKIEDMLSEISGVSRQREGTISSNELVGNVERSVTQSAHITEPLFWIHSQVKKQALTMLLNTAKSAWKNNKTALNYIMDDATRAFIKLSDDFFYEDMDIFITDSTKNQQWIEQLKQLLQPAMQNGASLLDVAEVITLDNITMIKNKLEDIEEKRLQQQLQLQLQEAERQQLIVQMLNETKQLELEVRQLELDMQRYKIDQDNATKIATAEIQAYKGIEDLDQNNNGIPDPMEIAQQALAERKLDSEDYVKKMEGETKLKEQRLKKEIEDKKIALERDKMKHDETLQKQKDDAAMQREKLKASTALKNKVTGLK